MISEGEEKRNEVLKIHKGRVKREMGMKARRHPV